MDNPLHRNSHQPLEIVDILEGIEGIAKGPLSRFYYGLVFWHQSSMCGVRGTRGGTPTKGRHLRL